MLFRSLEVVFHHIESDWVLQALSYVQSGSLKTLQLTHWCYEQPRSTTLQLWADMGLDALMSSPPFLNLRLLKLSIICPPEDEGDMHGDWSRALYAALPQCYRRGIIEVQVEKCACPFSAMHLAFLLIVSCLVGEVSDY